MSVLNINVSYDRYIYIYIFNIKYYTIVFIQTGVNVL